MNLNECMCISHKQNFFSLPYIVMIAFFLLMRACLNASNHHSFNYTHHNWDFLFNFFGLKSKKNSLKKIIEHFLHCKYIRTEIYLMACCMLFNSIYDVNWCIIFLQINLVINLLENHAIFLGAFDSNLHNEF